MAIDIKLNTDADLGGVDKLATGLEQAADAAEDLEGHDADRLERSLDKAADAADGTADALEDAGKAGDDLDDAADAADDLDTALSDAADAADDLDDAADAAKDLEKHLGDAEDAAEDLSDSGKDLDKLGDAADEASQEIDRDLITALKKAASEAEATGKSARDSLGKGFKDGGREAETAMDGLKEEAGDSAREAAANFTGEFEDVGDFIQEAMANAFQNAGPLGMGAGLALAGAFGIAISKITASAEKQTKLIERRFEDMADNMSSSLSMDFIDEEIRGILTDSEDAIIDFAGAQEVAARTGLDLATVLRGYAGDATSAEEVMRRLGPATSDNVDRMNHFRHSIGQAADATSGAQAKFEAYEDVQKGAGSTIRDTSESISSLVDAMRDQQDAAEDARQASADLYELTANLNNVYDDTTAAIAATAEAGGDQAQVLLDQKANVASAASEYQGYIDKLAESGATSAEVQAEYDRLTGELRELGRQAGVSDADMDALIGTIMSVPKGTTTGVRVIGDQRAKAQLREAARAVALIPRAVATNVEVRGPGAGAVAGIANQIQAQLNARRITAQITGVLGRMNF